MIPKSIRWRLPLTYSAIALLTTASLGVVLLLTLRGFYIRQEMEYLESNALAVSEILGQLLDADMPEIPAGVHSLLQSQLDTFSYLTQTQIRVYDQGGELLADSGDPRELQAVATISLQVQVNESLQAFSQTVDSTESEADLTSVLVIEDAGNRFALESAFSTGLIDGQVWEGVTAPLSLLESPFQLIEGATAAATARSSQSVRRPLLRADNRSGGAVELLNGPAFGQVTLTNVAWGFAVAGVVAVVLSGWAGWFVSLRLSTPIRDLASVTAEMAAGDLSVRAAINREDEIGLLAGAFNEMAGQIQDTVATLRHFVADAAHELHTPLTALRTNLDLAASGQPDNLYVAQAREQSRRLQRLNDDLLDLSRLESGISQTNHELVDLRELLQGPVERYAAQAEQASLRFGAALPERPLLVRGEPGQLQRAIDNLVENGIKFTPAGGDVALSLAADGKTAVLTVTDSGIGIAAADLPHVLGRFYRGRNASGYPGSGLGLAIVRAVATAHGGSVKVSGTNPGTAVALRLPLAAAGER